MQTHSDQRPSLEMQRRLTAIESGQTASSFASIFEQQLLKSTQQVFASQAIPLVHVLGANAAVAGAPIAAGVAVDDSLEYAARQVGRGTELPSWITDLRATYKPSTMFCTSTGQLVDARAVTASKHNHRIATNHLASSTTGGTSILERDVTVRPSSLQEKDITEWARKQTNKRASSNAKAPPGSNTPASSSPTLVDLMNGSTAGSTQSNTQGSLIVPLSYQTALTPQDTASSLSSSLPRHTNLFQSKNGVGTPTESPMAKMIKRVQQYAVAKSGAIPVVNVETGKEELVGSVNSQKRAQRLFHYIQSNKEDAYTTTRMLREAYPSTPPTEKMVGSLRTMLSFSQDTVYEEEHVGRSSENPISLQENSSNDDSENDGD